MKPSSKSDVLLHTAATTNGETVTGYVDRLGFDFVEVSVSMTTSDNTSNNPSTLTITDCDDTNVTATNSISLVGDTDFTIPDAVTSGDWISRFNIDMRGRKRYLFVAVTPLTTQSICVLANLHNADDSPDSASGAMKLVKSI